MCDDTGSTSRCDIRALPCGVRALARRDRRSVQRRHGPGRPRGRAELSRGRSSRLVRGAGRRRFTLDAWPGALEDVGRPLRRSLGAHGRLDDRAGGRQPCLHGNERLLPPHRARPDAVPHDVLLRRERQDRGPHGDRGAGSAYAGGHFLVRQVKLVHKPLQAVGFFDWV